MIDPYVDLLGKVLLAIISITGAVLLRYLTIWGKQRFNRPKSKEPIDAAFDRLEKVATRLDEENIQIRKDNVMKDLVIADLTKKNTELIIENAKLSR